MDRSKRRHRCPDCGAWLKRETLNGKYQCNNPLCPVIYVRFSRHEPQDMITKITRAAVPDV